MPPCAGGRVRALLAALILLLPLGCANWSFDRVQMGQQLREYERVFPESKARRTDRALCYLERDVLGRTDAVVLLLTRDRVVCGKLHAIYVRSQLGAHETSTYTLRGEIDPELARYRSTGPIDMLRAVAAELTEPQDDNVTREALEWVAAGIVRLVQRWPHLGDEGPAFPRLTEMLERVPGGGVANLAVDERGVYQLSYEQTTKR